MCIDAQTVKKTKARKIFGDIELETGQRVQHRTGQLGIIKAQPDSDPIVRFDGESHDRVCYRSEIRPYPNTPSA